MIKNLGNKMEKMQESVNKDLEELKNKYTETNNTMFLEYLFLYHINHNCHYKAFCAIID